MMVWIYQLDFFFFVILGNPYLSEEAPPPFNENQDFDFGLDNKSIRRAFIRKVRQWDKTNLKSQNLNQIIFSFQH